MAVLLAEDQRDFHRASATCEIVFPNERADVRGRGTSRMRIEFRTAARACRSSQVFDPDRDRQIIRLESELAFFYADDERPAWLRGVMRLSGGRLPNEFPTAFTAPVGRLLGRYGPGTISVIQDEHRPVTGEVVANEPGADAPFFPAYSYFDQYLVVRAAGRTFTNREPLRVSATVNSWPPEGEVYRSERVTEFFDVESPARPAMLFGKCTIQIGDAVDADGQAEFRSAIRAVRELAVNR